MKTIKILLIFGVFTLGFLAGLQTQSLAQNLAQHTGDQPLVNSEVLPNPVGKPDSASDKALIDERNKLLASPSPEDLIQENSEMKPEKKIERKQKRKKQPSSDK